MALTVEDGTGLAAADSFVSLADALTYHDARGNTDWLDSSVYDDELKEEALRRASFFLSNSYTWRGSKVKGRSQSLAWPRYNVIDSEGWAVPSDAIPQEVKDATCEVALRELITPGTMNPDVTLSQRARREKVGPIEIEYANSTSSASSNRPVLTIVDDLISGLLGGFASSIAGSTRRA